jgi:peptidoglycan hydrolase CwlO-like protein
MEESITHKIQDLQSEIKKKEKSLASRGNEVKDLKSKIDALEKRANSTTKFARRHFRTVRWLKA